MTVPTLSDTLSAILVNLAHLALAFLLALPIGWDREQATRSAGLRTFPLVALAACGFMLIGQRIGGSSPEAQARIMEGLITGIGFIGGGAILKSGTSVHGTATAASIWLTGAVGAAVAYGLFEIAVTLSVINFVTLRWLGGIKARLRASGSQETGEE
ncbi:MAG TPA: MgtC/SapB family protein [Roseiflexaceae bacterium]|nr:MgtC/SapB family protein [Roseiflexaceae bacterium]